MWEVYKDGIKVDAFESKDDADFKARDLSVDGSDVRVEYEGHAEDVAGDVTALPYDMR